MNVPVVFILDDNYIIPTSVAISSMISAKRPDTHYAIYIVCASLSEESEAAFSVFASDSVAIHIIREDANRFSNLHHFSSAAACVASPSALLKFVLPELLPEQDKVLYLDGDILVRVDLSELYATDLEDNMVAAVIDSGLIYYKQKFSSQVEHYFNSGVMVLNLKQMRLENVTETLIRTKQELNDSNLMDQNVLNVVFDHRVKCLPIWYNFLAINLYRSRKNWELSDINELYGTQFQSREELFDSWKILHFSSKDKPWKNPLVLFADKWMKVYRCLPQPIKAAMLRVEQNNPIEIQTAVSVIIPVYNVEQYLRQSLDCILNQTLTDIEVICVDDGSTDRSPAILGEYAQRDARVKVLHQENRGAGAARNLGFSHAVGTYAYFFDADDLCSPELLEKTVARAEETEADIVAFDFIRFYEDGSTEERVGIHADWLRPETEVFSYRDCPDRIMSVINPTPWNKLYRTAFLREHQLKYEEISSSNDITFAAVSAACAKRISFLKEELFQYRVGHANTISSTKSSKLYNVLTAVASATAQVQALPYYDEIKKAAIRFAIDNYTFALEHNVTDWSSDSCRMYYTELHQRFLQSEFDDLQEEDLHNPELYQSFCIVRTQDYESIMALRARKLIVSFTSFPPRIPGLTSVLESIYNQSRQADRVILWLAESEFPQREAELPEELLALVQAGKLELRWCPVDLKPHKKYFYAMQENPDDIIVTIDDDILYPPNMLRTLYKSYLRYPNAVSTMRANLIILDEEGTVLPYRYWGKEADCNLNEPFISLLATGAGGVLYPPHLLPEELFDEQAIQDTCLMADDLWLKTMELLRDVPVVAAAKFQPLKYVPGSQSVALHHSNVDRDANDEQLKQIQRWMEQHYDAPNFWGRKLTEADSNAKISEITAICEYYYREREQHRKENRRLNANLQKTYAEKSELNRKLQQTYAEKSELNRKLQITYGEKYDRGVQIKELKRQQDELKKRQNALKKQLSALKKENASLKKEAASLKKENKSQAKKLRALRCSASFRIGRAITWPVRTLKGILAKLRKK